MLKLEGFSVSNWCWEGFTDDRLTRSLVVDGYDAEVIEAGLVYFIDQWEEAVAWRRKAYANFCRTEPEEFRYYLFCRSELDWALRQVAVSQQKQFSVRITHADRMFKNTVLRGAEPCCLFPEFIEIPDPKRHWWLFSVPRNRFENRPEDGFAER
jgi:hypothetical protein